MIERQLHHKILALLDQFPAVVLLGPRQVGKTTLAQSLNFDKPSIYLDLESAADKNKLSEPEPYLQGHEDKVVILDEIQRVPELFQVLRGLIDQGKRKGIKSGRFLLLGSASIELLKQSGESLAGRIAIVELTPLNSMEVAADQLQTLWLRGGFPDSFLAATDLQSNEWRENFIRTYLEYDIPQLGPRIPAETLRRFWTMLAHNQAGMLNAAQLARNLSIDGKTIARYLDLMVDLLLVRRLPPYHSNIGKRMTKSPKVYVRDSGLVHSLLALQDMEQLLGHPVVGASWEAFIIETILNSLQSKCTASFYRSSGGAEIDLILELPGNQVVAVEIKKSLAPRLHRGFFDAHKDVQPSVSYIVYPGEESYVINEHVTVLNVNTLIKKLT